MAKRAKSIEKVIAAHKHLNGEVFDNERVCHFLDYAAKELPGHAWPANVILKIITKSPRLLPDKHPKVKTFRAYLTSASVKRRLWDVYNREVISVRGEGVRASIDDTDILMNILPKDSKRADSSLLKLEQTHSRIDLKKVPDSEQTKAYRDHYRKVGRANRTLREKNIFALLRAPTEEKK